MTQVAMFTVRAWEDNVRQSQNAGVWKCDTLLHEAAIIQSANARPTYLIFYSSNDRRTWRRTGVARVTGTTPVAPIAWTTFRFVVDPGTITFTVTWLLRGNTPVPGHPQNGQRWHNNIAAEHLRSLLPLVPPGPIREVLRQEVGAPLVQTLLAF